MRSDDGVVRWSYAQLVSAIEVAQALRGIGLQGRPGGRLDDNCPEWGRVGFGTALASAVRVLRSLTAGGVGGAWLAVQQFGTAAAEQCSRRDSLSFVIWPWSATETMGRWHRGTRSVAGAG